MSVSVERISIFTKKLLTTPAHAPSAPFLIVVEYQDGKEKQYLAHTFSAIATIVGSTPADRVSLYKHHSQDAEVFREALETALNAQHPTAVH